MDGVKILSIDAKDLYIANNQVVPDPKGYDWHNRDGTPNIKKFINTLDYSLDLIKLRDVYLKVYRNRKFSWFVGEHEYTDRVINVTFKYSNKEFNKIGKHLYVKFGHRLTDTRLKDCAYVSEDGELIAIQTDTSVPAEKALPPQILGKAFIYKDGKYKVKRNQTLNGVDDLRQQLYKDGFWCNGIHYVRFKRSSGSSRVGKCLFIDEKLYPRMHKWEMTGIKLKEGQETDLAALEAYIALTLSSIIGTIDIKPYNILLVDDFESVFNDKVIATRIKDNRLVTSEDTIEIRNSIWDGQSLIDKSLLGEYAEYGMVLLRKNFFKSCCFNTNIQQFFKGNDITSVKQLNGITLAQDIKDVKLITTPSSIKYLKFGTFDQWLANIDSTFGVVKHEKKTHFFEGRMVQTHYQLLNTLQMSKEDMEQFLQPTFHYMDLLKTEPAVLRNHLKYPDDHEYNQSNLQSKNEIVFQLLGINERFSQTKWYQDFWNDLIKSYRNNLRCGHVLVNGNYSTLLGNPYEMLLQSIGKFTGESQIGIGNVHSTRFEYGKRLLGSRSPHVCTGNVLLVTNSENLLIDKYFNLTEEIVCINSICENILQRLSGCDFDSDTILLTDNILLILAAIRYYDVFKVPTNAIEGDQLKKRKRKYTAMEQADLDIKTSQNLIGDIINLSQELQSYMWHQLNNGKTYEDIKELYFDICQLDIMSGLEIDRAKKEFPIDNAFELKLLKSKWLRKDNLGRTVKPYFFGFLSKSKGYYNDKKKNYLKHDTSMDYLVSLVNSHRLPTVRSETLSLIDIIDFPDFKPNAVKYNQIKKALSLIKIFDSSRGVIWSLDELSTTQKFEHYTELKKETVNSLSSILMSKHTLYKLLRTLEESEERFYKQYAVSLLFSMGNQDAYELVARSQKPIAYLEEDHAGSLDIYGIKYKKTFKIPCNQ